MSTVKAVVTNLIIEDTNPLGSTVQYKQLRVGDYFLAGEFLYVCVPCTTRGGYDKNSYCLSTNGFACFAYDQEITPLKEVKITYTKV